MGQCPRTGGWAGLGIQGSVEPFLPPHRQRFLVSEGQQRGAGADTVKNQVPESWFYRPQGRHPKLLHHARFQHSRQASTELPLTGEFHLPILENAFSN